MPLPPESTPAPLDYATPKPPRAADRFTMVISLLPLGILGGVLAGSVLIDRAFQSGDSRNAAGMLCILGMAPPALIGVVVAGRETLRPRGPALLAESLLTGTFIAAGTALALWLIVRVTWLR